jgi:hypothetical protein
MTDGTSFVFEPIWMVVEGPREKKEDKAKGQE